jgi:membrane protein implicated in regulation of membrane protease activity
MSYSPEWIPGALLVLIALLVAPPLAMIAFAILVLVVLALLLALAGAIAATPFLLFRSASSRWVEHVADRRTPEPTSRGLKPLPSSKT